MPAPLRSLAPTIRSFPPALRGVVALLGVVAVGLGVLPGSSHAQEATGAVEGVVRTTGGEAAPGVNVRLEGTQRGTSTDAEGGYTITGVEPGGYTLVVSYVGLETKRREVDVSAGQATHVAPITLESTTRELEAIVVEAGQRTPYDVEESDYVAKLPVARMENPQVYNTITADLLEDQVVTDFEDALTNAPGIFKLWESTGRGGDGAGYYALRGFSVQPTMVNGLPALTNGSPDPANVERIEVIKGPSGTLYGSSLISYGGLINVVTKKPYDSFGGEVSYKTGSFGLNRVTADVNVPVDSSGDIAVRVNGAYHSSNTFQDAGFTESVFVAPSLSYEVNDRLSFLVNTEYYHSESTSPTMLFLNRGTELDAHNLDELGYEHDNSYTDNALTMENPTLSLQGQMRYEIADGWTSQTAISRSSAKSDGFYSYLYGAASDQQTFTRNISDQNSTTTATDLQQNVIGEFEVAGLDNRLVVGLDVLREHVTNNSTGYVGFDQISLETPETPGLSRAAVNNALAEAPITSSVTQQTTYSAYASDVVDIVPQLSLMASLRVDRFDQDGNTDTEDDDFQQTALSPKLGVVVKPLPERLSLFANYMNGFSNVAPRVQGDGTTATFDPEQANQWEVGVKADAFEDRVSATVSYYDITVSDVVRQAPDRPNFYIQDGENYSRGVETSVRATPVAGLNLIAGYSYNESEVTETDNEDYLGRRPESAGPKHLVNGWVSYRLGERAFGGVLDGLGVGFGGNYASENVILNRATTGRFTLDAYTVLNASVSYETSAYRLALKVNNLADEEYYKGWTTVNPQAPRSATASFSYKF